MSYQAYERTAGDCQKEVEALCRHLTNAGVFDTTTNPTLANVEKFITDTYDEIGVFLVLAGYAKIQTDADIIGTLQHFNALGACAKVELTQPSVGFEDTENTRYNKFFNEFKEVKELIKSVAFERLGATRSWEESDNLTCGGISISDKEDIEEDTNHPNYTFTRTKHKQPSTAYPELEKEQ